MALNLIDYIQEQFTPSVIDQLGNGLGESSANTRKAVEGIIPTVLGSLAWHVQDDGADDVFDLLKDGEYSKTSTPFDIGQVTDTRGETQMAVTTGNKFIHEVLGDKAGRVAQEIATYSGIRPPSAQTLMGLVGSLLMGMLGRQYHEQGLSEFNLTSLLAGQVGTIQAAMPTGLASVGRLLNFDKFQHPTGPQTGVQGTDNFENTPVNPNIPKSPEGERRRENVRWLRWGLFVLAALVIGLLVQKCREPQNGVDGVYTDTTRRVESDAVEDRSGQTRQNVQESNGSASDSTAPGALGIKDSTDTR